MCFCSGQIRTLVAMATYIFHRLIMGNVNIDQLFCLNGDIWNLFLQKCLLSSALRFIWIYSKSLNLIVAWTAKRINFRKKMLKNLLLGNRKVDETDTFIHAYDIILYINFLEQRHIYSPKSTGNIQEAVAPSRPD